MLKRLWPASLFGRVVIILFTGLAVAQLLSFALVLVERGMASRGMMVSYLASDVASSVAMLERLPVEERASWLPRLARRNYHLSLEPAGEGRASQSALAVPIVQEVGRVLRREVRATDAADGTVRVGMLLADGTSVTIHLVEPKLTVSPWAWAVLAAQLALIAGLCWLAVRLVTQPLRQLADAANQLQPAGVGAPMPVDGPREVAQAAVAFNAMQARIRDHLTERMQILAAVSHDLQTPITRLRLRADLLDDATLRDKLHGDLAEMQALVEEGISYARTAHAAQEGPRDLELGAFLDSVVYDYTDACQAVQLLAGATGNLQSRPKALRRLLCNLVDNALKFAGAAEVAASRDAAGGWTIQVLDRGPGIPADQLQAALQPFQRLERSRSRATGGTGLGLAIASQLAQALGGRLVLGAREGGGLEARVELAPAPTQRVSAGTA